MSQGMKIGFVGQRGKPKRETGPWLLSVTGQRDNRCITDPDGVKKMEIQATGVGGEGLKQCLTSRDPRLSEILPHRMLTWGGEGPLLARIALITDTSVIKK